MLKIDVTGLSGKELENAVTRHCTAWGSVKKLRIYPVGDALARPYAMVHMETAAQAEGLAAAFGLLAMDNAVAIVLWQEQAGQSHVEQGAGSG